MAETYNSFLCDYNREFTVDKWGRPGGMYSLADMPIADTKKLRRRGVAFEKNSEHEMYHVRDEENPTWEFWVPFKDVEIELHIKPQYRVK